MKRSSAEKLLTEYFEKMDLENLQKYHVKLIDAWRESRAEYGFSQAVRDGYYAPIASESASGYMPVDLWLTKNLADRLDETEKYISQITSARQKNGN